MSENRVIGRNNAMPWSIKEDMARFAKLTKGCPCIMGRRTWESLPKKPLPGRLNIVVSRTMTGSPNFRLCPSLSAAIDFCANYEKVFICGGEAVYRQALEFADKIELTVIHKQYEGDAFFPEIDSAVWSVTNTEDFDAFSFITYTKNTKNKRESE